MNAVRINSPAIPYWGNIPGNLFPGKAINVKGLFPQTLDTSVYTQMNLCEGSKDIIAFHMSVRFNHREVVRTSFRRGQWENEEKGGPFPFELGSQFWMQIVVQQDGYHISVNGQHCWIFPHRMPFLNVNSFNIDGPLQIYEIEYVDQNAMYQPGVSQPVVPFLPPVYNPRVPFTQVFSGGIQPGMMIYISGMPLPNFQRFTVNFQCGTAPHPRPDIAFHFDVRRPSAEVVRNTLRDNKWGKEEKNSPNLPFQASVPFDMMILIQSKAYMVAVNGQHFIQYDHRITQFPRINTLRIENDVNITSVRFAR